MSRGPLDRSREVSRELSRANARPKAGLDGTEYLALLGALGGIPVGLALASTGESAA